MNRLTRVPGILVLVVGLALFAGCSANDEQATLSAQPTASTTQPQGDLDRRYALDESVRVGPYEITMTRVRFITDPDEETGLALRPDLTQGMAQLDVEIKVRNPADQGGEGLPQPRTGGAFRLVGDGVVIEGSGVGFSPPSADPSGSDSAQGLGDALSREIVPGEAMYIYPDYLVSADDAPLTLEYRPLEDDEETVIRFELR